MAVATEVQTGSEGGGREARRAAAPPRRFAVTVLITLCVLLPAMLAADRPYLGYGTETDFLGNYTLEAQRLLAGETLEVGFHPPFYAAVLALARTFTGDWQGAGLLLSLAAAAAGAVATFSLARRLLGPAAALGALVALVGSPVFLQYAAQAGTDVFFFALYLGCCALALAGIQSGRASVWRAFGITLGAALLTRTNAITLLLLLAAPFFAEAPRRRQIDDVVRIVAAAALPIILWSAYAIATASPILPTSNYVNLAMTYFAAGADRMSADAYAAVHGRFDGTLDVLLHDPPRMIATYANDLLRALQEGPSGLLAFPLFLLFLPGLLLLVVARGGDPAVRLFGLVFAAQLLLINFKAFEARYFLFLLPVLGAGLGSAIGAVLRADGTASARWLAASVAGGGVLLGVALATQEARSALHVDGDELVAAVPAAREVIAPGDVVVARKPHLSFYTGARFVLLPDTADAEQLQAQLCAWSDAATVHLFYGRVERDRRSALRPLLLDGAPPPWLRVEAASRQPDGWRLFRATGCAAETTPAGRGGSLGPWTR